MRMEYLLRSAALACVLIAGSCSTPSTDPTMPVADGAANHPISVEPSVRDLKLGYAGPQGMSAADAVKFDAFLTDYRLHGNGSLGISVPAGAPANAAITFFAERAAATGISRDKILVSTHDGHADWRVDVSYISYTARTDDCGDWSEDLDFTLDNSTPKNFGCAVQKNIAAQVADPRDLVGPGAPGAVDTERRMAVMGNYEVGKITQATKRTADQSVEQSAPGSDVGQQ